MSSGLRFKLFREKQTIKLLQEEGNESLGYSNNFKPKESCWDRLVYCFINK